MLNCKKGQGKLQLGTGYTAIGDTLNCNWGRSKIEFHYVPNHTLKVPAYYRTVNKT